MLRLRASAPDRARHDAERYHSRRTIPGVLPKIAAAVT
jgi:hypothetical protein